MQPRTHRARAMAFNPVVQDVFAVCSADLSVDLWRYARKKNELEKLSERNDVTPIGGVKYLVLSMFCLILRSL